MYTYYMFLKQEKPEMDDFENKEKFQYFKKNAYHNIIPYPSTPQRSLELFF